MFPSPHIRFLGCLYCAIRVFTYEHILVCIVIEAHVLLFNICQTAFLTYNTHIRAVFYFYLLPAYGHTTYVCVCYTWPIVMIPSYHYFSKPKREQTYKHTHTAHTDIHRHSHSSLPNFNRHKNTHHYYRYYRMHCMYEYEYVNIDVHVCMCEFNNIASVHNGVCVCVSVCARDWLLLVYFFY